MRSVQPTSDERIILPLLLGGVALAAGITGLALLARPADTGVYFSWGLDPSSLAALIGGSYLASLVVFGLALRGSWVEVRGLAIGTLALSLPVLASTLLHLEVFDFDRWQAWGWLVLFIASPLSFGTLTWRLRRRARSEGSWPAPWAMPLAGLLAIGFLAGAVLLWVDPEGTGSALFPFDLPPLGGRVLGSWMSFLAFLAAWVATHTREESRVPALGLTAFAAGAVAGGLRTFEELRPGGPYLGVLVVLTAVGGVLLAEMARQTRH